MDRLEQEFNEEMNKKFLKENGIPIFKSIDI
jgi:hypothetical protein